MFVKQLEDLLRQYSPTAKVTFWDGTEFELLLKEILPDKKGDEEIEVALVFNQLDNTGD